MRNRTSAIAMAVLCAGLASALAAHAQSNVAISGFLDLGAYRGFDKIKNVGTIQRSNIAFAGAEELGDGLKATFRLSHRLDLDTGATEGAGSKPFWQGESTVGLNGAFGSLRLGRALDVVVANDWAFDPWSNFNRLASPAWSFWHYNYATDRTSNNGGPEYGRLSNGIFYDSPSFNGFAVHLNGSFEKSTAPGGGTGNASGVSLNYDQGPASAMLATARNSNGDTVVFLAGKYAIGDLSLMGAYDNSEFKAATNSTAKVYTLGAVYQFGPTALKAGYGRLDLDGAVSDFVGLGADYALSKRTGVYVSLGHVKPRNGSSASAYGVGLQHSF